jgi:WD40 repeat protein
MKFCLHWQDILSGAVRTVAFSSDNTRIVSDSADRKFCVWDAMTYARVLNISTNNFVFSVSFSPNSQRIISGCYDGIVQVRDAQTGQHSSPPSKAHSQSVGPVIPSLDGRWIVSSFVNGKVRVLDAKTGRAVSDPFDTQLNEDYKCIAFAPDGKRIAWISHDNAIQIWTCARGHALEFSVKSGLPGGRGNVAVQTRQSLATTA